MIGIRPNSILFIALLLTLLGVTQPTVASEITGTLSSDGSSQNEAVTGQTSSERNETNGQIIAQNNGQIQGSVVQGREESAAATAVADISSWGALAWVIPIAGLTILAAMIYLLRSRRII